MANRKRPEREVRSAGGVIINKSGEILFCHPTHSRWTNWRMPKGVIAEGEDLKKAALREVLEETGWKCRIIKKIESIAEYPSRDVDGEIWKRLELYLMEPIEQIQQPDDENDAFRWVPFDKVEKYVSKTERPLIMEAIDLYNAR